MKLSIGIVGLPNVGKSTLFNLLTKQEVLVANYPFATIDPNVGIVPVPDKRLSQLTEISKSKKTIPAVVEFYDIAGLVKGAHGGEGLGNQFLSHIREAQAIVHIVRCFSDENIIHVEHSVDPLRDLETINTELLMKDLETLNKRVAKAEGEAKTGDKQKVKDFEVLQSAQKFLAAGNLLTLMPQEIQREPIIKELQLLTGKPQIFLLNGTGEIPEAVLYRIKALKSDYLVMDLAEAYDLTPLITKAYEVLGLISFFTTGEDETRAWTVERGAKAPQAVGVIHTDFEHKFIRAEIVSYDDLVSSGGWSQAKQKGKMRLEGKDYEVKDGDVIVVRHG
ncbi:MAG: hypothetical protein A3F24_00260 [Candidatus Colwellbacteria bacterium RIFCSPHIGHO2_12_FULL_44_17]|uniref:Redox-regulated ATPase YchF n=2 Tax=Candidatus Colwelliibacteriota TaxID=1817904 RepID=A0A1G1Z922_9BACT|nr:MAG: hypothetical protein A3F24_00260 [Candidatus Colwellbacteria bacterium RIFCSPHIGHO2_12_FULL_44_17]OGY60127.1 MAG: hypothetical protein A3I31_00200 [Candidatus Colwellbacteria bacterium RIFCSPLOWO2_02_FULL_44_20b]